MFSISAGCWYVGVQGARGAAVLHWSFQAATPSSWSVHHWKGGASWRCTQAWGDRPWRVRILEELLPRQQLNQVCMPHYEKLCLLTACWKISLILRRVIILLVCSMEEALGNYAELPPPCKHPTSLLSLALLFAVSPDCRHIHMPSS
jgi:hypothetical protein